MPVRDFSSVHDGLKKKTAGDENPPDTLAKVFSALARGEFTVLSDCFTPDAEFRLHGFPGFHGHAHGRDQVIAALVANFGRVSQQVTEAEKVLQDEETVAVFIRESGLFKDGRRYRARGVIWCRFEKNRIRAVDEFVDVTLEDIAA